MPVDGRVKNAVPCFFEFACFSGFGEVENSCFGLGKSACVRTYTTLG